MLPRGASRQGICLEDYITGSGTISNTTSSTSGTSIVSILTDLILEITGERERCGTNPITTTIAAAVAGAVASTIASTRAMTIITKVSASLHCTQCCGINRMHTL